MRIVIDAMGGDIYPAPQVEGSVRAAAEFGVDITLVGERGAIQAELDKLGYNGETAAKNSGRIDIVDANDIITNHDDPAKAVRSRKDASIVVAANLLKDGKADALVSAGATGGVLAAGLLVVGRIAGVQRPALTPIIPTDKGPALLLDVGANSDCKPGNLVQFGIMGSIYMSCILGKESPKVALLNIGEEEHKGNELVREAYALMKDAPINFTGNIEGRELMEGAAEVIVCDGFVGNVVLKLIEGLSSTMLKKIKGMFMKGFMPKMAGLIMKKSFTAFKKEMDYTEYGGAILLGTKHPVIKAHGSSNAHAIFHSVRQAKKLVDTGVVDMIQKELKDLETKQNTGKE